VEIFLLTLFIFLVAAAGLAIGVIAGRDPLTGSCGSRACARFGSCGGCGRSGSGGHKP